MEHLFDRWNKVAERLKGKYLFIFLDFDGTLTPIADTPGKAVLPAETKLLLRILSDSLNVKLALISGRNIRDIRKKVRLKNIIYSGNHGLEIEGPKIKFKFPLPPGYRKTLKKIRSELKEKGSSFRGILIEDKGVSLSLHYRLVDKKEIPALKAVFRKVMRSSQGGNKFRVRSGKMVLEVRPAAVWDKGKVVLWLLRKQSFAPKGARSLPIYIGDDTTDEDAFKALKNKGLSVFVGRPKGSRAQYYLKNTGEVKDFLRKMAAIRLT